MNEFSAAAVPLLHEQGFLDEPTCSRIRAAMDRGTEDAAEIVGDAIALRDTVRRARSVEIEPGVLGLVEDRFERLRPALERAVGRRLGPREGTGFLRYHPGGFYLPHRDRGDVHGWPAAARRAVAVVLFLNRVRGASGAGDFDGGLLCLYPAEAPPVAIRPEPGLLVAFPADLLHEVQEVRAGTRDAAVDWFYDWTACAPLASGRAR